LKLLQENIGETPQDIGTSNNFLNRPLITQETNARTGKWDCIKLQSFCTTVKRQPTEWEKIFACYSFDKGSVSSVYEELKKKT
jgi:hypothetical protein